MFMVLDIFIDLVYILKAWRLFFMNECTFSSILSI